MIKIIIILNFVLFDYFNNKFQSLLNISNFNIVSLILISVLL